MYEMFDAVLPSLAKHATQILSVLVAPASMPSIEMKPCVSNVYSRRNATGKPLQILTGSQDDCSYIEIVCVRVGGRGKLDIMCM